MALLLDSSVLIDYLRGREAVRRRLLTFRGGHEVYTCAINVEEVTRGIRPEEEKELEALLEGLAVAPLGVPEGRLAGFWRRSFAKRGRTLHQSDCLIAAAAAGVRARLVTGNPKDFPMRGIEVEHWPAGE